MRIYACTSLAKRINLSVVRNNKVVGFFDGHPKQCGKKLRNRDGKGVPFP